MIGGGAWCQVKKRQMLKIRVYNVNNGYNERKHGIDVIKSRISKELAPPGKRSVTS